MLVLEAKLTGKTEQYQQFQIQKVANNTDVSIKIGIKILRKPKLQFHSE